jgi:hypothetical protein
MANEQTLQGRWCLIPTGEYTLTGEITLSVGDHHLVKIHTPTKGVPSFSRLMTSDALCAPDVMFFDSQHDLENWLAWTPDGGVPRVLAIKNKKKKDKND